MINKLKSIYGNSVRVISIQEYLLNEWTKNTENLTEEELINKGVTILSYHMQITNEDDELINLFPDINVI